MISIPNTSHLRFIITSHQIWLIGVTEFSEIGAGECMRIERFDIRVIITADKNFNVGVWFSCYKILLFGTG